MPNHTRRSLSKIITIVCLSLAGLVFTSFIIGRGSATAQGPSTSLRTQNQARAYSGPGDQYPLLAIYTQGITLTVTGRDDDSAWLAVMLSPYQPAWMKASDLSGSVEPNSLAIAPTLPGLVTVTPEVKPLIELTLSVGFSFGHQSIGMYVETRQPHTKISIDLLNSNGKQIWRRTASTDADGIYEVHYGSATMTNGTYTVAVTDGDGNTVDAKVTLNGSGKPSPTPDKKDK